MISYCRTALSHVSDTKITRHDIGKIKTTGCYAYYKPVVNAAKMVLNEITLGADGKSGFTGYVVPYAVSMDKLFEMYVRAYLKHVGVHSYQEAGTGLRLLPYDYKSKVLKESGKSYANYIGGNVKPDIILQDTDTEQYIVFDVKYKNLKNRGYSRSDRLQVLAYALLYNCENVGIIFPARDGEGNFYYAKNEIQSNEKCPRYYNQLEIAVAPGRPDRVTSVEDASCIRLSRYLEGLLPDM